MNPEQAFFFFLILKQTQYDDNIYLPYIFGTNKNMCVYIYAFHYLSIFPLPFDFNCLEILKKILWNASGKLAISPYSDKLSCK